MKLNTSTDYAIRIMLYLAEKRGFVSSTELSKSISTSQRYALQIASELRDGGLVHVSKGMAGGYCLAKPANEISLYDIILLSEGSVDILKPTKTNTGSHDVLIGVYTELEARITEYLKRITLDVLAQKACDDWRELVAGI